MIFLPGACDHPQIVCCLWVVTSTWQGLRPVVTVLNNFYPYTQSTGVSIGFSIGANANRHVAQQRLSAPFKKKHVVTTKK